MTELQSRWTKDPLFEFIYRMLTDPSVRPDGGMTWEEWYATRAPRTYHSIRGESLDCRALNIDGLRIGAQWLGHVLDDSSAIRCTFDRTEFQSASAQRCNFKGSRFIVAQMSPIYAPDAIFRNCIFDSCFLMGIGPRHFGKGAYSNLCRCDFTGARAIDTGFLRCDFRGSCFVNARFTSCDFLEADLRDVDPDGAQFEKCDFGGALIDNSLRVILRNGGNIRFE
jgi:uncharacterized protein YjbI with pentapeptide repeats